MARNYPIRVLACITFFAFLLSACSSDNATPQPYECQDDIGCITILPDDPLVIGVLQVQTGGTSRIGIEQIRTFQIAIAERGGRLLDHDIELVIEDSLCSREGGEVGATRLLFNQQMVAVFGTSCSASAVVASPIISSAGLVMVSGSNTAPSLTTEGTGRGEYWQPGYFRTVNNDLVIGALAALFAYQELDVRKAATINDGDAYTTGLTNAFAQDFIALGGEIVLDGAINKGDEDMIPVLTAVAESEAEFVFVPIFEPEGNYIILQKEEVEGLNAIAYLSADGLFSRTFFESVGEVSTGMYFVVPNRASGELNDKVVSTYASAYGEEPPSPSYAFAYDAAALLFNAIETAAVVEGDGTVHIPRQGLRDALQNHEAFQGLSGIIECDEFGDCSGASFSVIQLDDPTASLETIVQNVVFSYTPE